MSLLSDLGGFLGEFNGLKDELLSTVTDSLGETKAVVDETVQQVKDSASQIIGEEGSSETDGQA